MDYLKCGKLESVKIFGLDILIPLTRMLKVYMDKACVLSPDEFCILIFARKDQTENYKQNNDMLAYYIKQLADLENLTVQTQTAIVDLFMNIVRYKLVLEAVSNDFVKEHHYRSDSNSPDNIVLIYVLVYRISGTCVKNCKDFLSYYKISKILSLVSYLLRPQTLDLVCKTASSIFDKDFVEERLAWPFMDAIPYLKELRLFLREEKKKLCSPKKLVTVPQFMRVLNHYKKVPHPPPPTPEDLKKKHIAREVPRSMYVKPISDNNLATIRASNKLQAINLLNDANKNAPTCARRQEKSLSKPMKPMEDGKMEMARPRKPIPLLKSVEVKQTAASILRECARIKSDETKEANRLKELAEGGHDSSLIQKLEEEKRRQEKEEESRKLEEKYLAALLTREGVFIAKETLMNSSKSRAEIIRKERQELCNKLERCKNNHKKEVMEIVEKCREIEQASRNAITAMAEKKRRKGAETSEESRLLKLSLAKQREEEMQRKIRLIQEIRTIQSLRCFPQKDFDPTESSGLGLLCEMSLAELHERLVCVKLKLNTEIEERKSYIRQERDRQKDFLKSSQKALEEYKASRSGQRSISSLKVEQCSVSIKSSEIESLRRRLQERRRSQVRK